MCRGWGRVIISIQSPRSGRQKQQVRSDSSVARFTGFNLFMALYPAPTHRDWANVIWSTTRTFCRVDTNEMKARIVWLILCGIWGSTWLSIKLGLRDLPPLTFAGIRFLFASG